jgi:hypothetical protein
MSGEIEAAQIAADAAIRAARMQGEWTFGARGIAFVGGLLALGGAVIAAARQVRLEETKHKALVAAYRVRMTDIAIRLCEGIFSNSIHLMDNPDTIRIEPLAIQEELSPSNWRDHALLGRDEVIAISDTYQMVKRFHDFSKEMRGKPANAQSKQFGQPIGDSDDIAPGIETYRHMNKALSKQSQEASLRAEKIEDAAKA